MVKLASFALFVLTSSTLTVQACQYCECQFANGTHCCIYNDVEKGEIDCPSICKKAHRADGKTRGKDIGTPCGTSGRYKCASAFTALDRTPCYRQS
ncbi:hypothetical protein DSL72_002988 [Monilinia vaccinii-corymbosi]|uniref:Extracellular membrane protein CFEM domain-containing protein n=1 Tax=Monilinia vaccinii-corymbosi TaxID=61207 RepID=A0A8A3PE88_9HELO|nr:hypothetical protein DSL72_002988 [Monilinia vaccinii-corymbosi]